MSEAGDSTAPRRSQREKKQATQFVSRASLQHIVSYGVSDAIRWTENSAFAKRKRSDETTEDEGPSDLSSLEDEEESEREDADDEEDFAAPKPTASKKRKGKAAAKPAAKPKGPPPAKKPRTTKTSTKVKLPPPPTTKKGPAKGKGKRKVVNGANAVAFDAEQVAKDTKIAGDNALFSA